MPRGTPGREAAQKAACQQHSAQKTYIFITLLRSNTYHWWQHKKNTPQMQLFVEKFTAHLGSVEFSSQP